MKKVILAVSALAVCAAGVAIGLHYAGANNGVTVNGQPALEPALSPTAEAVTTTEAPATAEASEAGTRQVMNGTTPQDRGFREGVLYNPDLNEYYDGTIEEWDPVLKQYVWIDQWGVDPNDPEVLAAIEAEIIAAEKAQEQKNEEAIVLKLNMPTDFQQALDEYNQAMEQYWEENGDRLIMRSDWILDDDKDALDKLEKKCAVKYFSTVYELMAAGNNEAMRTVLAEQLISSVIHPRIGLWGSAETYISLGQEAFQQATEAVLACGKGITAEQVAELQEQYGYLVAPALEDLGKLNLMQIDPDDLCTDPAKLAEFARYFA